MTNGLRRFNVAAREAAARALDQASNAWLATFAGVTNLAAGIRRRHVWGRFTTAGLGGRTVSRETEPQAVRSVALPNAACAAARRATGTRNGLHET